MTLNNDVHAVMLRFSNDDLLGSEHLTPNALHIVDNANLVMSLNNKSKSKYLSQKVTFTLYQLMEEADLLPEAAIVMESQTWSLQDLQESRLEFDASEILQSWLIDESTNQGLRIDCDFCHYYGIEFTNEDVYLSLKVESTNNQVEIMSKRASLLEPSQIFNNQVDCPLTSSKRKPRCCRESMKVDFSQISGFEFIQQPRVFDAYMCRGRCPARFNAVNDHSLLQSIMHVKTKHLDPRSKVHRPCCVGTKYEPLDILHVDDKNPNKLKVTHWKNVIVSQCGCA